MSRPPDGRVHTPGRIALFGHEASEARVVLERRSRRWRAVQALQRVGLGLVVAPLLALVPPHAPWAAGSVLAGLVLGRRRWQECYTLVRLEGRCPRCDERLTLGSPRPLRSPLPLDCPGCHHQASLHVSL